MKTKIVTCVCVCACAHTHTQKERERKREGGRREKEGGNWVSEGIWSEMNESLGLGLRRNTRDGKMAMRMNKNL